MTQLDLPLIPMHAVTLFARLDGKLARWEGHAPNVGSAVHFLREQLGGAVVLALIHKPPVNLSAVNTNQD